MPNVPASAHSCLDAGQLPHAHAYNRALRPPPFSLTACAAACPFSPDMSAAFKVACSRCNLRELCLPAGLSEEDASLLDDLVAKRRKVKRGAALFNNGDSFTAIYAIRTGFFKTCILTEDGRNQVTGFQMAGEIIGLDGIVGERYTCDAVALEDAEVCEMANADRKSVV